MSGSIRRDDEPTAVVESRAPATDRDEDDPTRAPTPGARVGRYLVIEELGRGGMGVVLRAYDPKLQREVALKRLRAAALDESAQARLIREARAMARLNHPNVVGVYDVELDAHDGDVVVVMEYVPGCTLRRWLQAEPRSWRAIVDAFIAAGRGLSAAHAENLLHRDFKLDNVLAGDDGRMRVTDFGLARSADSRSAGESLDVPSVDDVVHSDHGVSVELTRAGVVMGTPPYMAPEQHEGWQLDPRTDQYALCVALWRALTQRWPFEGHGLTLLHSKRAGAPKWPSDVAVPRHVTEAIRRGLSPQPRDRWPTISGLLVELSRDPSRRRHRMLAVGALALGSLTLWGATRYQRARALAACVTEAERIGETWNDARADEIAAAFQATQIAYAADTWVRASDRVDAYVDAWSTTRRQVCERGDVDHASTPELTLASRTCLDEHRDELDALLRQLADPDATVVHKATAACASLPLLEQCTDETRLRRHDELPSAPEARARVAVLRARLAEAAAANATGRYEQARNVSHSVLQDATELTWVPLVAEAKWTLADAQSKLGEYELARVLWQDAMFEAGAAGRDELALRAATSLVGLLGPDLARYDEALTWARFGQMLLERLGLGDDLRAARLLNNIGLVSLERGDHAQAIEAHERALAIRQKALGPDHPEIAMSFDNLGRAHCEHGDFKRAVQLHERALAIKQQTLGPEHPELEASLTNLGIAHANLGEYARARERFESALAIVEKTLGPDHARFGKALLNIAGAYQDESDRPRAIALYERAVSILDKTLGPDHPLLAKTLYNLAAVHYAEGEHERALGLSERALAIQEKTLGPDHPDVAITLNILGLLHLARGEHARARALYERALATSQKAHGPEHATVGMLLENLAQMSAEQGAFAEAIELYERGLTIRERSGAGPEMLPLIRFDLARAHWNGDGDRARAIELAVAARDGFGAMGDAKALAEVDQWLRDAKTNAR